MTWNIFFYAFLAKKSWRKACKDRLSHNNTSAAYNCSVRVNTEWQWMCRIWVIHGHVLCCLMGMRKLHPRIFCHSPLPFLYCFPKHIKTRFDKSLSVLISLHARCSSCCGSYVCLFVLLAIGNTGRCKQWCCLKPADMDKIALSLGEFTV